MHQVIHEFSLQYLPQKKKKIVCNIKKKKKKSIEIENSLTKQKQSLMTTHVIISRN